MLHPGIGLLGQVIYKSRKALDLSLDEFGSKYDVSGPAMFKFEKGFIRPSLQLWLRMARAADVSERRAVLLWLKSRVPEKYQRYVELPPARPKQRSGILDYSTVECREDMKAAAAKDNKLPKALRDILKDDELRALYKPTGHEAEESETPEERLEHVLEVIRRQNP